MGNYPSNKKEGKMLFKNNTNNGKSQQEENIYKWTNIPCLHVLTGRVKAHKVCVKNYECYHCAYDQMIDDEDMDFLNENPAC